MPQQFDLLFTLVGGLTAALVLGLVTQRLRLSPIVGYLLAGVAVGPFTPGFVAHGEIAQELSELGVILLMFGVGLKFHVKELIGVRRLVVPGALAQLAVSTGVGTLVAHQAGLGLAAGAVFGLAISVASTVVAVRMLSDSDALQTPAGSATIGWLVVEDLLTVLVLVLLPIVAGSTGGGFGATLPALSIALLEVAALIGFTWFAGRRLIPVILGFTSRFRSRELFMLAVLVLALGIAVGSAKLFGVSMALGAFLAGMVVGQSQFSTRAASEVLPMRDAFAVLFFLAMGMLLDPALRDAHRTIVVGYGPVGRSVGGMLRDNAIEPTIVERSEAIMHQLESEGWRAVHGDAAEREVLERAGVRSATGLIFAASSSPEPVIRMAKEMNPRLLVLARTTYLRDRSAIQDAGADVVVAEGEVALAVVERVLRRLGATADRLDRARERVHEALTPGS